MKFGVSQKLASPYPNARAAITRPARNPVDGNDPASVSSSTGQQTASASADANKAYEPAADSRFPQRHQRQRNQGEPGAVRSLSILQQPLQPPRQERAAAVEIDSMDQIIQP